MFVSDEQMLDYRCAEHLFHHLGQIKEAFWVQQDQLQLDQSGAVVQFYGQKYVPSEPEFKEFIIEFE